MLLTRLQDLIAGIYDVRVAHDVYDFAALRSVGQVLFDGSVPAR